MAHLDGLGPKMIQNPTELYHLEHLGGLETETIQMPPKTLHLEHLGSVWPATDQDITKAGHVERLGGLEPEMIQDDTKTDHLDVQKAPCTFTRQKTMGVQKALSTTCRRHLARSEIKKLIYWVHTLTSPSN